MIEVSLNDERVQLPEPIPLQTALARWQYGEGKFAVAVNGEFVPRSRYESAMVRDGDRLDIVKPVGGG